MKEEHALACAQLDITDDIYGSFRVEGKNPEEPKETAALLKFVDEKMSALRLAKRQAGKIVTLPAIGPKLFTRLWTASGETLRAPCFHAAERLELELNHMTSTRDPA